MLKIDNYSLTLSGTEGQALPVLENISLHVKKGTCLGLAGESGSGKSVMAMSVVGLIPKASIKSYEGHIYVDGAETTNASEKDLNRIRGKEAGFIFQEPMTAMNPLMKLSEQISEVVYAHNDKVTKSEADKLVIRALLRAGFKDPEKFLDSYPHQLSGGMRQRAMIAMALVMDPKLIIADEPTTAIDAELQIQLLKELRQQIDEQGLSMLFISHDLGVLRSISDNIAVLYAGNLMEVGPADEILKNPIHPYTADLISALPRLVKERKLPKPIEGTLPSLDNKPQGCVYADRCSRANDKCRDKRPELTQVGENHCAACWNI